MDLIFVKIKDNDGDTDHLNIREISDIQPDHGELGGWQITMTNSVVYIVSDDVYQRICGAIKRFGEIVDCTCGRTGKAQSPSDDNKNKADSPRHITFS